MSEWSMEKDPDDGVSLSRDEADLCRQWFNAIQDLNPRYPYTDDFLLARKLHDALGIPVPELLSGK